MGREGKGHNAGTTIYHAIEHERVLALRRLHMRWAAIARELNVSKYVLASWRTRTAYVDPFITVNRAEELVLPLANIQGLGTGIIVAQGTAEALQTIESVLGLTLILRLALFSIISCLVYPLTFNHKIDKLIILLKECLERKALTPHDQQFRKFHRGVQELV